MVQMDRPRFGQVHGKDDQMRQLVKCHGPLGQRLFDVLQRDAQIIPALAQFKDLVETVMVGQRGRKGRKGQVDFSFSMLPTKSVIAQ